MIDYPYSMSIWMEVVYRHNILLRGDTTLSIWTQIEPMGSSMDRHRIVIAAIVFNLWLERNKTLFMDRVCSIDHCISCITKNILLWTTVFGGSGMTPYATNARSNASGNLRPSTGTTESVI